MSQPPASQPTPGQSAAGSPPSGQARPFHTRDGDPGDGDPHDGQPRGHHWTFDDLPVDPDVVAAEIVPPARRRAERALLVAIAAAGAAGALARYVLSRLVSVPAHGFPWATFWVNVTGSLAVGFVLVLLIERFPRARLARPVLVTGFLGAYTTFSTYVVDADLLVRHGDVATALAYGGASLAGGVLAAFFGMVAARSAVQWEHRLDEELS